MFKVGALLLTACLFNLPVVAQEDSKAVDATIVQLKESLAKAEAALVASRAAETKARQEAESQRLIAEKTLKALEVERQEALQARAEAEKLKAVAEQQQLEAKKAAEAVKAAIEADAAEQKAANAAEEKARAKEFTGDYKTSSQANIAALEKQVEVLTRQMQDVQAKLEVLQESVTGLPGGKFSSKLSGNPFGGKGPSEKLKTDSLKQPAKDASAKKQDFVKKAPVEKMIQKKPAGKFEQKTPPEKIQGDNLKQPLKEAPIKEPKSTKKPGLAPGKASN